MKKKDLTKLLVIPVVASAFMLSNMSPVFAHNGTHTAQEQKLFAEKKAEIDKYAKEIAVHLYKLELYSEKIENASTDQEVIKISKEAAAYLKTKIPSTNSLKGKYSPEVLSIHDDFVAIMNHGADIFEATAELFNEDLTDEDYEKFMDFLILKTEELIDVSYSFDDKLTSYIEKYHITPSKELSYLLDEDAYPDYEMETTTYIVKKGDTLYSIAKKHDISVNELKKLNNLKNDKISVGQKLVITKGEAETPAPSQTASYTVKKGDTLYSIAKKHGMTVNELKSLNKLKSDTLKTGQVLKVTKKTENTPPVKPTPEKTTTKVVKVKSSLNVRSSGSTNGKVIGSLKNNDKVEVYSVNGKWAKIKYKNGVGYVQADYLKNVPTDSKPAPTGKTYTVQKGDTLYKISQKTKVSVAELKKLNNLKSDTLKVGQVLKVSK